MCRTTDTVLSPSRSLASFKVLSVLATTFLAVRASPEFHSDITVLSNNDSVARTIKTAFDGRIKTLLVRNFVESEAGSHCSELEKVKAKSVLAQSDLVVLIVDAEKAASICTQTVYLDFPTVLHVLNFGGKKNSELDRSDIEFATVALGSRFGYIEFDLDPKSPHFEEAFVEAVTLALTTTAQRTDLQLPDLLPRQETAGQSTLYEALEQKRKDAERGKLPIAVVLISAGLPIVALVMAISSFALCDSDEDLDDFSDYSESVKASSKRTKGTASAEEEDKPSVQSTQNSAETSV